MGGRRNGWKGRQGYDGRNRWKMQGMSGWRKGWKGRHGNGGRDGWK